MSDDSAVDNLARRRETEGVPKSQLSSIGLEDHTSDLLRFTTTAFALEDRDGAFLDANPAFCQLLGYEREELLGLSEQSLTDPEDLSQTREVLHALVSGVLGEREWTKRYLTKSGERRWCAVQISVLGDLSAKPRLLIQLTDLTHDRAIRAEKEASDARWQAAIDALPGMVALWDLDLKNIFANRAYVSFFGKAPEQIRGRHIFELLGPELYARNEPFMRRALAGESVSFERDIPTPEGVRHTHAAYMPMWDASKIAGMFVFVTDNSELKQAQMKLTTILDSTVEVGIISLDMTGRIWVFSKGAELLLDVSSEKILGTQNLRRFFDGDELKAQQAELGIDESDESYAGPHRQDQFWCFFRYDHASLSRAV